MECNNCNKKFGRKDRYEKHVNSGKCFEKKYECNVCRKLYKYKNSLKNHLIQKHNQKNPSIETQKVKCILCGKKFYDESGLKYHILHRCKNNNQKNSNNTINIGTNIIGSTINNINNNINLFLNKFSDQSLDIIPEDKFNELLKNINSENINKLPIDFVKMKHIDTERNRNIYLDDPADSTALIYEQKWVKTSKLKAMIDLVRTFIDNVEDFIEKNKNKYNYDKDTIDNFLDKMEKIIDVKYSNFNDKNLRKEIFGNTAQMLSENKDIIAETAKKNKDLIKN